MTLLANNLRYLRTSKGKQFSGQRVSEALGWKRSTLNGYELGIAEPGTARLIQLSNYYGIAIDLLLRQDLTKLSQYELGKLTRGYDARVLRDMMGIDITPTS